MNKNPFPQENSYGFQNEQESQYRKIFVGGLPHNLSDEEFKAYFVKFGDIEDSAILRDKRTGKPRGFGFVTYMNLKSLDVVMDNTERHVIQGKWVDCKRAVPASKMKDDGVLEVNELQPVFSDNNIVANRLNANYFANPVVK